MLNLLVHVHGMQEARAKDKLERSREHDLDVRSFLETAYLHPAMKASVIEDPIPVVKGGIHNLLEGGSSELPIFTVPRAP